MKKQDKWRVHIGAQHLHHHGRNGMLDHRIVYGDASLGQLLKYARHVVHIAPGAKNDHQCVQREDVERLSVRGNERRCGSEKWPTKRSKTTRQCGDEIGHDEQIHSSESKGSRAYLSKFTAQERRARGQ